MYGHLQKSINLVDVASTQFTEQYLVLVVATMQVAEKLFEMLK